MPTPQSIIQDLVKTIHDSLDKFNSAIPGLQNTISAEIELLVKQLEIKDGKILPSAKNLKTIGAIKAKIEAIIINPKYTKGLEQFRDSFNAVTVIQNKYFSSITKKFKPTSVLKELRLQAIGSTMESLSRAGIGVNIAKPIQDILRTNITTGAKYTDLVQQLRDHITNNATGQGKLERYVKQITTDSLNTYSRTYNNFVANDLGLKWNLYSGSIIATSRIFCIALIEKKYFHDDEIPALLKGDFEEFRKHGGTLNDKTGLPDGMIPGTTVENFKALAGGYGCGHSINAVHESIVPESIRQRFSK